MITRLDEHNAQDGIANASPGDVILLERSDYYGELVVGGKTDLRIVGEGDAVYCEGFKIGYCTDVQVTGVASISTTRWPLVIYYSTRVSTDIIAVAQPWPSRSRPEFNNAKVCDINRCQGLDLAGAAIGWGRKTLGVYQSAYVNVHDYYARFDGFFMSGKPYTGKCLAPSYHTDHLTMTDVVGETGEDADHVCDVFSSDRSAEVLAMIYIDRMLLINKPGGVRNRYGFGWLQNDDSYGVTVRNLTLDIATGNAVMLKEGPRTNMMDRIEMVGRKKEVYNDGSWEISAGLPDLPRLTERLKRRVTEATRRSNGRMKVFA